jgi:Mrp family chromosome partitioning ATPase
VATVSEQARPYVIVLGNEKGGSGKSTTAIHIIVALLREGYRVGAMDLDARQGTLGGTLAARKQFVASKGIELPLPDFRPVHRATLAWKPKPRNATASTPSSPNSPKPVRKSSSSTARAPTPTSRATATPMPTR